MIQDARYALRALRRAPGFAAIAAVTLAVGIGANVAIFSVAWQVLVKPLPFPSEDRLVTIWEEYGVKKRPNPVAPANFLDWKRADRSFEAMAAFNQYATDAVLTGLGEPQQIHLTWVTEDFFRVLALPPVAGRPIVPGDAGREDLVIVLGERLWRHTFGADPAVVGRTIQLDGTSYEVIGVMPDAASIGTMEADAWVRLPLAGERAPTRQAHFLGVVGRLRPGVTLAQAHDEVSALAARAAAAFPDTNRGLGARVRDFREQLSGSVRQTVLVLLGCAALVLLIACANITGLQLARHVARRRETAIRAALGASRRRLLREFLIEGVLLSTAGGYLGLLLAMWILATLAQLAPAVIARDIVARPDLAVVCYTLIMSALSGALVALPPAWRAVSFRAQPGLAARGTVGDRGGARARVALMAVEVALAVVVLTGATLLVASLVRVLRVDTGFEFEQGLTIDLALPPSHYPDLAARARFFDRAIERVEALPGVERACVINAVPLTGQKGGMTYVPDGETRLVGAMPSTISPGCLDVLHIHLKRGRGFKAVEPEPAALVSESMARDLWPNDNPIGRRIHIGLPTGSLLTVVGVVANIHHVSLESAFANQVWVPHTLEGFVPRYLLVRTTVPPLPLVAPIRASIREMDPNLPVSRVRTMKDVRAEVLGPRRFDLLLLGAYGLIALTLCSVGVYGLLSQIVGQRTQEIGVRMALGAQRADVVRQVMAGTAAGVVCGAAAGAFTALLLSRLVRNMLFEVSPTDPWYYAAAASLVVAVALMAAYVPARRATRIDPLIALRN